MTDNISIAKLQQLHPKIKDAGLAAYGEAVQVLPTGVHPVITETWRSLRRSNDLYELGRTVVNPDGRSKDKPMGNIVSNSRGGQSYHNYRLALDFTITVNGVVCWNVDENWMKVVNIFKRHGFSWGGDFPGSLKDCPHLENRLGYKVKELFDKYKKNEFIPETNYLML